MSEKGESAFRNAVIGGREVTLRVILDRDGQGRGSYMSASAPIATAIHQNVIRR